MEEFYKLGSRYELSGHPRIGSLGVKIYVAMDGRDLTDAERCIVREAVENTAKLLRFEQAKNDVVGIADKKELVGKLLECFPVGMAIYVEEVPNEYCADYCCVNKPWLVVTTPRGRMKIGWRKRVIQISWHDIPISHNAEYLFPNEDVTKDGRMIHAWGYEKAKEYIAVILGVIPGVM